ncbi:hypothetical protein Efla_001404 [Eimeria flavescens]
MSDSSLGADFLFADRCKRHMQFVASEIERLKATDSTRKKEELRLIGEVNQLKCKISEMEFEKQTIIEQAKAECEKEGSRWRQTTEQQNREIKELKAVNAALKCSLQTAQEKLQDAEVSLCMLRQKTEDLETQKTKEETTQQITEEVALRQAAVEVDCVLLRKTLAELQTQRTAAQKQQQQLQQQLKQLEQKAGERRGVKEKLYAAMKQQEEELHKAENANLVLQQVSLLSLGYVSKGSSFLILNIQSISFSPFSSFQHQASAQNSRGGSEEKTNNSSSPLRPEEESSSSRSRSSSRSGRSSSSSSSSRLSSRRGRSRSRGEGSMESRQPQASLPQQPTRTNKKCNQPKNAAPAATPAATHTATTRGLAAAEKWTHGHTGQRQEQQRQEQQRQQQQQLQQQQQGLRQEERRQQEARSPHNNKNSPLYTPPTGQEEKEVMMKEVEKGEKQNETKKRESGENVREEGKRLRSREEEVRWEEGGEEAAIMNNEEEQKGKENERNKEAEEKGREKKRTATDEEKQGDTEPRCISSAAVRR